MSVEDKITTDFHISVVNDLRSNLRQAAINFNNLHNLYEAKCARVDQLSEENTKFRTLTEEMGATVSGLRRINIDLRSQNREAHGVIAALRTELTALRQQRDAQNAELHSEMDAQVIANNELRKDLAND